MPIWYTFRIFAKRIIHMKIVSARDFRSNQSAILSHALKGEDVLLMSRIGVFKITPVTESDTLTKRICSSLREVRMIEDGQMDGISAEELLNEL